MLISQCLVCAQAHPLLLPCAQCAGSFHESCSGCASHCPWHRDASCSRCAEANPLVDLVEDLSDPPSSPSYDSASLPSSSTTSQGKRGRPAVYKGRNKTQRRLHVHHDESSDTSDEDSGLRRRPAPKKRKHHFSRKPAAWVSVILTDLAPVNNQGSVTCTSMTHAGQVLARWGLVKSPITATVHVRQALHEGESEPRVLYDRIRLEFPR